MITAAVDVPVAAVTASSSKAMLNYSQPDVISDETEANKVYKELVL